MTTSNTLKCRIVVSASASGGGLSGPGGSNTHVQFNDNGVLSGTSALTFAKSLGQLVCTGNIQGGTLRAVNLTSGDCVFQGTGGYLETKAQQTAINTLTAVSSATNEHVLTKDTTTGNAIWKAASLGTLSIAGQTAGDVLYYDGAAWTRLARDVGKYLKSGASSVSWDNPVGGTGVTGTRPIMHVYRTTTNQILNPPNVWTPIVWEAISIDTISGFSLATGKYTPTVAGYYQVHAQLEIRTTGGPWSAGVSIYKNGTGINNDLTIDGCRYYGTSENFNTIVYMNGTTDYLEVYGICDGGLGGGTDHGSVECDSWFTSIMIDDYMGGGTGGGSSAFSAITSGTNTSATMEVGAGSSLTYAGGTGSSGSINANKFRGNTTIALAHGGTALTTVAAGSILAANSTDVLSAITSTSGTKYLCNTSGTISWASAPSGSTSPGGSNTQVQFNDSGTFGGDANLSFNKATGLLSSYSLTLSGSVPLTLSYGGAWIRVGGSSGTDDNALRAEDYSPSATWTTAISRTWEIRARNATASYNYSSSILYLSSNWWNGVSNVQKTSSIANMTTSDGHVELYLNVHANENMIRISNSNPASGLGYCEFKTATGSTAKVEFIAPVKGADTIMARLNYTGFSIFKGTWAGSMITLDNDSSLYSKNSSGTALKMLYFSSANKLYLGSEVPGELHIGNASTPAEVYVKSSNVYISGNLFSNGTNSVPYANGTTGGTKTANGTVDLVIGGVTYHILTAAAS